MSVKQPAFDKLLPVMQPESTNARTTVLAVLDIAKSGTPAKDADYLKAKYPIALTYDEELRAAVDFSNLEVLPSLPEIMRALDIFRRIEKSSSPKAANGNGSSGINLSEGGTP